MVIYWLLFSSELLKIRTKEGDGWRSLFWFSSGLPLILICWRLCHGESAAFIRLKQKRRVEARDDLEHRNPMKKLNSQISLVFKTEWLMFVYLVVLMSGYNFMSHGSPRFISNFIGKATQRGT